MSSSGNSSDSQAPSLETEDPIIRSCRDALSGINRSFVITQFIKESLDELKGQIAARKKKRIRLKIPSFDGSVKEHLKPKEEVEEVLNASLQDVIYQQAFVSGVSIIEDCITTSLREALKATPQKLALSVDGEKIDKNIPLSLILESGSLESLLDGLISSRVLNVMYDRPLNYFKHLKAITGFEISNSMQTAFIEIKASRDVLVHNQGFVNSLYLEKTGSSARGKLKQKLIFDDKYFAMSMGVMKQIALEIYQLRKIETI